MTTEEAIEIFEAYKRWTDTKGVVTDMYRAIDHAIEAMKQNEKMRKALGFYADEDNYIFEDFIAVDNGKLARETLKEIDGDNGN